MLQAAASGKEKTKRCRCRRSVVRRDECGLLRIFIEPNGICRSGGNNKMAVTDHAFAGDSGYSADTRLAAPVYSSRGTTGGVIGSWYNASFAGRTRRGYRGIRGIDRTSGMRFLEARNIFILRPTESFPRPFASRFFTFIYTL